VSWSIVVKVKRTLGSPFFGALPSDRNPKAKKNVNVHIFVHSFTFRNELIMDSALAVKKTFTLVDSEVFCFEVVVVVISIQKISVLFLDSARAPRYIPCDCVN